MIRDEDMWITFESIDPHKICIRWHLAMFVFPMKLILRAEESNVCRKHMEWLQNTLYTQVTIAPRLELRSA